MQMESCLIRFSELSIKAYLEDIAVYLLQVNIERGYGFWYTPRVSIEAAITIKGTNNGI